MEYNLNNNGEEREPVVIREKDGSSNNLWYWVLGILILLLLGWYGYTVGWFSQRVVQDDEITQTPYIEDNQEDSQNLAPIDSVRIETLESFPVQQQLVVSGSLPDGCTYLNNPRQIRDGNVFYVTVDTRREGELCTDALVPFEERIPLQVNNLPAGVYIVNVNGREISFELENDNKLDFSAGEAK